MKLFNGANSSAMWSLIDLRGGGCSGLGGKLSFAAFGFLVSSLGFLNVDIFIKLN